MPFTPFHLERWQCRWEHRVRHNLAESGVRPLALAELLALTDTDPARLLERGLGYSQTNGTDELRATIASMYPGATADHVLVTVGGSEANFLAVTTLAGDGQPVAVQVPNYLQTSGVAANLGAPVATFPLRADRGWEPDLDAMREAVRPGTRLVVVTDPNNPTGHVLSAAAREAIVARAAEVGAWLLVDEIYRGAEREGAASPSWWGASDRVIVSSGLSKAYGLPGLRIGWLVGPTEFIAEAEARHDYVVIGPSGLSDFLACRTLAVRDRFFHRTREILRENYAVLETWLQAHGDRFHWHPPTAGAICAVGYDGLDDAEILAERWRAEEDVLLVPGPQVGLDRYFRFGFGYETQALHAALEAVDRGLRAVAAV